MPNNPFAALAAQFYRGRAPAPAPSEAIPPQAAEPGPPTATAPVERHRESSPTVSLHILSTTGHHRFDSILAGCVGTLDDSGCFKLDADYARLSYLFTLAGGSSLPAVRPGAEPQEAQDGEIVARRAERTLEVAMPAPAAHALKMNIVATGARGWDAMYATSSGCLDAGALGANMLQAERRMVSQAVSKYLEDSGLAIWNVPVIYQAIVQDEEPIARETTEAGLMAQARAPSSITPDITREPKAATQVDAPGGQTTPVVPHQWATHRGALALTIEGDLRVHASSPEQAAQVTTALLLVAREIPRLWQQIRPTGRSIQAAQLLPPSLTTDHDDDDDDTGAYRAPGMGG